MKIIVLLTVIILLFQFRLEARNPAELEEFLQDISRQSQQFKNSPDHLSYKSERTVRDYQVGDEEVFWSWALNVMPPDWMQTPATCRAVGEYCYLFVADDQWNLHMEQTDVDEIMPYLEEYTMNSDQYGAIEMDIINFGPIPDELDNDPKVIVFYMELGSFGGSTFDGYFSSYNQVTEAEAQNMNPPGHSNECEMIYMTCYPLQPADPIRISVLSHELQHLIHWGADLNESTWVNEGCSELAMVLFGLPDPITGFPNNPDNSLITWNQQFADYVKTMLFFTYLKEHFGDNNLIADIVADPANSITGIQNQLIEHGFMIPFEGIFNNWTIANYLDDPAVAEGQYCYDLLDLPAFNHSAFVSSFPYSGSGSVNAWAAEYIRVNTNNLDAGSTLTLNFETADDCGFTILYYEDNETLALLNSIIVDGDFELQLLESEESYYKIVLVISNNDYSSFSYNYSLETQGVQVGEETIQSDFITITGYPNPVSSFSTSVTFNISNSASSAKLEIFNIKGQKIRELHQSAAGQLVWDLTDQYNRSVPDGVYLYRLANEASIPQKILLMK
ncbi:MAG: hypothetical protein APR54_03550 [Candidatus Cloacimonas sp. SDB]|nr:MAG: hypothetical protein APR54_03550 [Candidatus Cloacimonas sp. SDB]